MLALLLLVAALAPGDHERTLRVGGRERHYRLHVPARRPEKAPLVLAFHGGLTNGRVMERYSGLSATADEKGFLVAYPDGTGRLSSVLTWNSGRCCGYAHRESVDDVAFARALIDDVAAAVAVDDRRVYATGISNGGMLAYRLAAEMGDRLAAIAPVAASLEVALPPAARPIPIVHFHGTADRNVPIGGGEGDRSLAGLAFASLRETLAPWIALGGCRAEPVITSLADRTDDGTRVERRAYEGCRADIVTYVIENGGHTWPGSAHRREGRILGPVSQDISANEVMWAFFAAHARP